MAKGKRPLTQQRLKELLDYDPETGVFRWRFDRSGKARVSRTPGHVDKSGRRSIRIDGRLYNGSTIAWFYVHGVMPGRLIYVNRIVGDDRIENLALVQTTLDEKDLTADRLRDLLDYDRRTGVFRWKHPTCMKGIGDVAGNLSGKSEKQRYWQIKVGGQKYPAHRLAWLHVYGEWPTQNIDHIDRDRTNNAIANLRVADLSQNQWNRSRSKNNTSGFKGVSWDRTVGKWKAAIAFRNRNLNLGSFSTKEAAAAAYAEAARKYHGEFARTE